MAPKNRNAAQAFASDTSALPRERKKKRSRSKHRNETQNATSSIEVDEESPPTKAEKGKKKHQKGDKTKPDSLKDENPSKHSSIQAGSKQQHSATKKEDGNHSTASLQHLASISEKQNSDHSESKSKPRKRQALRAPVFEKGWGTGEVRWSASEDFDKSFLVKGVAEVNFDGFVFTNAHANAIISAPKKFRKGLDMLDAGWIDKEGITDDARMRHADEVTNETLESLAKACPNLTSVDLYGRLISDVALKAFFQHCPKLESFTVCSNGIKINGKLRGSALKHLRKNPDWAPELFKLYLYGYDGANRKLKRAISKLTDARPELCVDTEDNVTRLRSMFCEGHESTCQMSSAADDDDDDDTGTMGDWYTDASDEDDRSGYGPTLDMDMVSDIFGDSSLGDFIFNQYANGNNMNGFMF